MSYQNDKLVILLPEDQYLDMFDSESDISGDNSEDELVEVL